MSLSRALLTVAALLASPAPAHAGAWRAPVAGPVLRGFALDAELPYAAGQHRGVDLRAPAGTIVRAACGGTVRFAGRVGAAGRTVTIACAGYLASYVHLGSGGVRAGARVRRGDGIGTVGRSGYVTGPTHLHLGARRRSDGAYVDPLGLIRASGPVPPALVRTPPRPRPRPPRPVARPVRVVRRDRPAPVARAAPTPIPWAALAGLALLAIAAAPAGAARVRSSRARHPTAVASERRA